MLTIKDNKIILDKVFDPNKVKKITGHSFVGLANLDEYNKRGDVLLNILGYYKPPFDKKYQYRGDMAEQMIMFMLKKNGKEFIYYDEADKKKNNYDFFPTYKYCGGIPDFEIPKESTNYECKSKSMEKLKDILSKLPTNELWQGLYYTYLRKYHYNVMAYVFFDKETEELLFQNKKPKTLNNCQVRFFSYKIIYNENEELPNMNYIYAKDIKAKIIEAICYRDKCITEGYIPLEDVSPKILKELGLLNDEGL